MSAEDRSWQQRTKEPFGLKYKICMTIWTCPCFSFRNSWNFVFFVLVCVFNLKIIFSLCLLPLVREVLQKHLSSVLWLLASTAWPVPRSDGQGMGLQSSTAAHQLSVIWGTAHSEVLYHGTGGWAHLVLIGWVVPGRLQSVGGTSLQECWDQLERVHRRPTGMLIGPQRLTDEERA